MLGHFSDSKPFVSVIIPVYNDPEGIRQCLNGLMEQTYPESKFEVLIVDNGSTDETRTVIEEFPYELLIESDIQGSYAARNKGIRNADGEILAFIDADCIPEPDWLGSAVATLEREDADLAAGRVKFEFTSEKTAAERFDALVNMRNDKTVKDGVAKTANLFARKSVVNEIGLFPSHLQSGGDVFWTQSATDDGFRLVYGPEAAIRHPSRQFWGLVKKMYRIGRGNISLWKLNNQNPPSMMVLGAVRFPLKAFRFVAEETESESQSKTPTDRDIEMTLHIYAMAAISRIAMNMGRLSGLIQSYRSD